MTLGATTKSRVESAGARACVARGAWCARRAAGAMEMAGDASEGAARGDAGAAWLSEDATPRNDALDKLIISLFVPAMLNFLIIPLVGAVDVFWVGRLEDAVALAAQGAANQVFQSAFWIISFIPSVVAPVVAKAAAGGDTNELS